MCPARNQSPMRNAANPTKPRTGNWTNGTTMTPTMQTTRTATVSGTTTNAAGNTDHVEKVSTGKIPSTRVNIVMKMSTSQTRAQMSARTRTSSGIFRRRLMLPCSQVHLFSRGQGHTCTLGLQSRTVTYTGPHCTLVTTSISYAFRQIVPHV